MYFCILLNNPTTRNFCSCEMATQKPRLTLSLRRISYLLSKNKSLIGSFDSIDELIVKASKCLKTKVQKLFNEAGREITDLIYYRLSQNEAIYALSESDVKNDYVMTSQQHYYAGKQRKGSGEQFSNLPTSYP